MGCSRTCCNEKCCKFVDFWTWQENRGTHWVPCCDFCDRVCCGYFDLPDVFVPKMTKQAEDALVGEAETARETVKDDEKFFKLERDKVKSRVKEIWSFVSFITVNSTLLVLAVVALVLGVADLVVGWKPEPDQSPGLNIYWEIGVFLAYLAPQALKSMISLFSSKLDKGTLWYSNKQCCVIPFRVFQILLFGFGIAAIVIGVSDTIVGEVGGDETFEEKYPNFHNITKPAINTVFESVNFGLVLCQMGFIVTMMIIRTISDCFYSWDGCCMCVAGEEKAVAAEMTDV